MLTQEQKEQWVDGAIGALDGAAGDTLQVVVDGADWKKVEPEFGELAAIALRKGIVMHGMMPTAKQKPRLRISRHPLLVKLANVAEMVDPNGVVRAKDTEKRALAWIAQASGIKELRVLTLMVMDLEVRMAIGDEVPSELGAWARLAQVLMDNFDERVAEVH